MQRGHFTRRTAAANNETQPFETNQQPPGGMGSQRAPASKGAHPSGMCLTAGILAAWVSGVVYGDHDQVGVEVGLA